MDERYDKNTLDRTVKALEELVDNQQQEIKELKAQVNLLTAATSFIIKDLEKAGLT